MERREYKKPVMQLEKFVPNNYCADCSDEGHTQVTYIFKCGNGLDDTWYYIHDGNGNYQWIDGKWFGPATDWDHYPSYHYEKCTDYHEITLPKGQDPLTAGDIYTGLYLDKCYTNRLEQIPVVIWTNDHTNVHCTVELDPREWQLAKS